ncbi:MAG: hypothetical protein M3O50_12720 [Myxococcota bacterium]|nr:hypothetical protein [Myxococcota bacterium]
MTITETVDKSWQFAPLEFDDTGMWGRSRPPQFTGKRHVDTKTPFNGPNGANPYLVVSINGHTQAFYSYPYVNCWNNPGFACSSTIQIDPVPYSEPGTYYNSVGVVGTQANPFTLSNTVLYADPSHAGEWASRVANGVQEWGTFSNALTLFGTTKYKYLKQYESAKLGLPRATRAAPTRPEPTPRTRGSSTCSESRSPSLASSWSCCSCAPSATDATEPSSGGLRGRLPTPPWASRRPGSRPVGEGR